jgi:RNA polymerase sigma factor (sigma-70 family)
MAAERQLELDALLEKAQRSGAAFGDFYRSAERSMLGFFMRQTGRPELAADLTAETFARALESLEAFDRGRGRADQWLFGIARHVLADSLRRGRVESAARRRLGMPDLILDDHAADSIARMTAASVPAIDVLAVLPEAQRVAVAARVIDERGYAEIAAELECSEALVRQHVSRGLRTIRRRLGGTR